MQSGNPLESLAGMGKSPKPLDAIFNLEYVYLSNLILEENSDLVHPYRIFTHGGYSLHSEPEFRQGGYLYNAGTVQYSGNFSIGGVRGDSVGTEGRRIQIDWLFGGQQMVI